MKLVKLTALAMLSLGFFACGSSEADKAQDELTDALNELNEELNTSSSTSWKTINDNSYFSIDIPDHMKVETTLNAEASLQYAYVEQVGTKVKEHYMIVLMETHEEIDSYELETEFDAASYGALSAENLGTGLDEYTIMTENPEVKEVNGMDCVRYEMEGAMGDVQVYYELGVFEGEHAFYQVLTWTILDQKPEFKADMDKIITSFKEK
ncbi:MAG: hypothetical protein HYZ14_18945 [Bacteroidetes bacterium]|nr:hypothetical protein [Bacteroidota bacterium]